MHHDNLAMDTSSNSRSTVNNRVILLALVWRPGSFTAFFATIEMSEKSLVILEIEQVDRTNSAYK